MEKLTEKATDNIEQKEPPQNPDAAERDAEEEFKTAVDSITRLRMRVKPDVEGKSRGIIMMMMLIIVAGVVFVGLSKNRVATIVIAVIIILVAIAAIVALILTKASARKVYYCYYIRDERGVFCMSVIGDTATVFDGETAYRVEGDSVYTLMPDAYAEYLDGEGTGLYAAVRRKELGYGFEGGAPCCIKTKEGGSHEYFTEDGKLVSIYSSQPYKTQDIDEKTGKAKINYREYEKTDPTEDFILTVPDFVKQALSMYDIEWRE